MKSLLLSLSLLVALGLVACGGSSNAPEAETGAAQDAAQGIGETYTVDPAASKVMWAAYKTDAAAAAGMGSGHNGVVMIKEGALMVDNGAVTGGNVVIDMTSMDVTDIPADVEAHGQLLGHLKSGDFFLVDSFPTASLEIVSIEALGNDSAKVTANLTMLDTTNSITFPAMVLVDGDKMMAKATFQFNRKEWGIEYNGPDAAMKKIGDAVIRDNVEITFDLAASKGGAAAGAEAHGHDHDHGDDHSHDAEAH